MRRRNSPRLSVFSAISSDSQSQPLEETPRTVFERNKFFATTTIAGFNFIHRSNSRAEICLWYLLIALFLYITARNVIDLTSQYLGQTTVTKVTVGHLNRSYDLNIFKLRVRIGLPELNPEFHPHDRMTTSSTPLAEEVSSALEKITDRSAFFNTRWDYVLLPLVARYAFFISSCEFFNEYCNPLSSSRQHEFRTMIQPEWRDVKQQIDRVLNHTRQLNISDHDLLEELGRQVLRWIRFQRSPDIFTPWNGSSLGVLPALDSPSGTVLFLFELRPSLPVRVGLGFPSGVCLRTDTRQILDHIARSGVMGPNATWSKAVARYNRTFEPEMAVQFGIDNRRRLLSKMGQISYWSVEIISRFHSITNCLPDNSRHVRTRNCTSTTIRQHCGCESVLITLQNGTDESVPWCTPKQYMDCLANVSENIFANCTNACSSDCDLDFLDVRLADRGPLTPTAMEICLNVLDKELPSFHEHYKRTWQNFLAELGGAMDFWIGASVVGVFHLGLCIVKQIIYAFSDHPESQNETVERSESVRQTSAPPRFAQTRRFSAEVNRYRYREEREQSDIKQLIKEKKLENTRLLEQIEKDIVAVREQQVHMRELLKQIKREIRLTQDHKQSLQKENKLEYVSQNVFHI